MATSGFSRLLFAIAIFLSLCDSANATSKRLSQETIEQAIMSPTTNFYYQLPDSECDIDLGIKRCIGVYIPEIRSYFPKQIDPNSELQISFTLQEIRVWASESGQFIILTMETRGPLDFVVTDQAEMHRRYFERVLPSDQLDQLASANWPSKDFFANVDLKTNILSPLVLDHLSKITGADFRITRGHGSMMVFGYPKQHEKLTPSESLLLEEKV
ncbi:MAG: hypothetical protein N4A61_16895 [Pelagimonas sp.]|jgi:hypothetical protein|nr:hypothetical protein [Pelagimonas sp.]